MTCNRELDFSTERTYLKNQLSAQILRLLKEKYIFVPAFDTKVTE